MLWCHVCISSFFSNWKSSYGCCWVNKNWHNWSRFHLIHLLQVCLQNCTNQHAIFLTNQRTKAIRSIFFHNIYLFATYSFQCLNALYCFAHTIDISDTLSQYTCLIIYGQKRFKTAKKSIFFCLLLLFFQRLLMPRKTCELNFSHCSNRNVLNYLEI